MASTPSSIRPRGRKGKSPMDWSGKTTVMIRNIPSVYPQKALIAEVTQRGFAGTFDFFYLPMDFTKNANAGYAFANFYDVATVAALRKEFDGKRLELAPTSSKLIQVVPATLQGYDANFAHFAHSAVLNHHKTEHSPVFLRDGKLVTPTRSAKKREQAPRLPAKRTLVVRQVPAVYTHAMLFMELGAYGVGSSIEVLHLPLTEGEDSNLGTAYVVLRTEQAAAQFVTLDGAAFTLAPGAPPMRVERHSEPRRKQPSSLLPSPRPTSFEYTTARDDAAGMPEMPQLPELGSMSWEAFADPANPFEPEMLAAYAAMLNAYSTLPVTALHEVVSEAADQTLRELRGATLDDRFARLGIDVGGQADDFATPTRRAWHASESPPTSAPPTAPFDTNSFLSAPTPPDSWTPQRLRATSAPIQRQAVPPGKGKDKAWGKGKDKGSPQRSAITPPTTTAGSSQNSSPARTPRDLSLSPEHLPRDLPAWGEQSPFDLPSLLPSPSALLSLKTPTGFGGLEHFQPHSRA